MSQKRQNKSDVSFFLRNRGKLITKRKKYKKIKSGKRKIIQKLEGLKEPTSFGSRH